MVNLTSDPDVGLFDIETDGLLEECTKIHSIVLYRDGEYHHFADQPGYRSIDEGVAELQKCSTLVAHNGTDFDYPVLRKFYGEDVLDGIECIDTLNISRLLLPDLKETDMQYRGILPGKLIGSHSLKAWGYRLGEHKGDFGEQTDWVKWSQEMQDYCQQDVYVTLLLVRHLEPYRLSARAEELEHQFARVIHKMTRNGIGFNERRAEELYVELGQAHDRLRGELQELLPPRVEEMKTPQYWIDPASLYSIQFDEIRYTTKSMAPARIRSTLARGPNKVKLHPFNPGSRPQIAERLMEMGWEPMEFTKSGQPKVSDEILQEVDIPAAKSIAKYLLLTKRLGQLAEGDGAWLNSSKNGVIHGYVNTNGAVTGRCTHSKPNVAQVPSAVTKKIKDEEGETQEVLVWGEEGDWSTDFRALFGPTRPGWYQVGADASGLELRVLAHYLGRYDGGEYARVILEGDIHCHHRDIVELPPTKDGRNRSKTGIYCVIYGGGDEKLGSSIGKLMPNAEHAVSNRELAQWQRKSLAKKGPVTKARVHGVKRGMFVRDRLLTGITGFDALVEAVTNKAATSKHLIGLEGRRLSVRKQHAALNTLLQSGGALIVKQATVNMVRLLEERGLVWGRDWALMAHVHDEIQAEARTKEIAHQVGQAFIDGLAEVYVQWNLRCPLDGEKAVGGDWAETH